MDIVSLHDKSEIEACLRQNPWLHLYALGDLDDFYWPYTTWYGLKHGQTLKQLALIYLGERPPVLLALSDNYNEMTTLVQGLIPLLPPRLYSHLSGNLGEVLADTYRPQSYGQYYKMALTEPAGINAVDTSAVEQLGPDDLSALEDLYAQSYPGSWFNARMLATGCFYGIRQAERIIAAAGIHVYSPAYRVAALGNITTHPDFRGRGLARQTTAKVGQELLETVGHIGLNVKCDNRPALACYERLGFERMAVYEEVMLELR